MFEQHALTIGVGRARETHGCQAAVLCDLSRNGFLAGVAEWGVAKIMTKRNGFGQVLIQCQGAGNRARDLGNFKRMRQASAVMVALNRQEDLGFMGQATKRLSMKDLVAIALVLVTKVIGLSRARPSLGFVRKRCALVQQVMLARFLLFPADNLHRGLLRLWLIAIVPAMQIKLRSTFESSGTMPPDRRNIIANNGTDPVAHAAR